VSGARLLILGFLAVLAMGVALWWFTRTTPGAPVQLEPAKPVVATERPVAPTEPRTEVHEVTPAPPAPAPLPTARPSVPVPVMPVIPVVPEAGSGSAVKPQPVAILTVIREATVPTDDLIRDCIAKSGQKPSGRATLTFIVAKKHDATGDKVEVETTGFEEEGTTITNPELLECMHKTAYAMKFPVGEGSRAVFAKRHVTMDNGILSENWVYEWGQIR
jgi:hypothetical protein